MSARFTGLRPIEKNGLRGFGFSIHFDRDNQSRQPVPSQADRDAGSDEHLPVATGSNSSEVA